MEDIPNLELENKDVPLCVDLDGTLVKTDMLFETCLKALKAKPWLLFVLPFWLARSRAYLKSRLASMVSFSPSLLPYNQEVLDLLAVEKANGRQVVLCTASNIKVAETIAEHTEAFTGVLASSEEVNLKGSAKADLLERTYGARGFDYIGNDQADFVVWNKARKVLAVSRSLSFQKRVDRSYKDVHHFALIKPKLKDYLKGIRVHQWVKNALIFVPLVLDHEIGNTSAVLKATLAFFAFSLMASATYIINDLLDLEADRAHRTKRTRPFASGLISPEAGLLMIFWLSIGSLILLSFLSPIFGLVAAIYLVSTLVYSFHLKTMVILDACILAGLFTIRVIGGSVVIGADQSFWLLAFSMFLFLSLAFTKRASELWALKERQNDSAAGRGYIIGDYPLIVSMGVSSGYVSVMLVALYINSAEVRDMYSQPEILWLMCPLLLYWIGRIWLKTVRGEMNEDPIVFAITDRISHIAAVLGALTVVAAVFLGDL